MAEFDRFLQLLEKYKGLTAQDLLFRVDTLESELSRAREALTSTVALLDETASQLDEWAYESVRGGWSTHQVNKNKNLAHQLRQRRLELKSALTPGGHE